MVFPLILVGAQFGDEGKGKISDYLSEFADVVVRAQGGNNAGHTVLIKNKEYRLHLIPTGIFHPHTSCYICGGVVIDPQVLIQEIQNIENEGIDLNGRFWISSFAHLIMPYHKIIDKVMEGRKGSEAIGTTKRGIGPCYSDKASRNSIRMIDLKNPLHLESLIKEQIKIANHNLERLYEYPPLDPKKTLLDLLQAAEKLKPYIHDNMEEALAQEIKNKKKIIFEGAQGTFLDNTFGTFPFVTSSSTIASGICAGAGIGPTSISHTLCVTKAYITRVGNGPLPTQMNDKEVSLFDANQDREFGTTTGRKRRMGWFDAVIAKRAMQLNSANSIALTKLDILDRLKVIKICIGYSYNGQILKTYPSDERILEHVTPIYKELPGWNTSTSSVKNFEDLPNNAKSYIFEIENLCDAPISLVSISPERNATLLRGIFNITARASEKI